VFELAELLDLCGPENHAELEFGLFCGFDEGVARAVEIRLVFFGEDVKTVICRGDDPG